jgi:hypothetical protein
MFLRRVVSVVVGLAVIGSAGAVAVKSSVAGDIITIDNGFTKVEFDTVSGQIVGLYGDFHGTSAYSNSVLAAPFGTEVTNALNEATCADSGFKSNVRVAWHSQTAERVSFSASNIVDCEVNSLVSETWTVTLDQNSRYVDVSVAGQTMRSGRVQSITHSLYLNTLSVYGLFDRGVAQMMGNEGTCLGSNQSIGDAYFIGNSFGLDLRRDKTVANSQIVLHSSGTTSAGASYSSGFEEILVGSYPNLSGNYYQSWLKCWPRGDTTEVAGTETWLRTYSLGPNNYDFPLRALPSDATVSNLPFFDLQTYLMGLYGSPVGCLQSYYDDQTGIIAPTISHPDVGYSPDTNFFDPDNFISVSAMMYSGDEYLMQQVRDVLERTGETMCGIGSNQLKSYCDLPRQRIRHVPMHVPRFHGPVTHDLRKSTGASKHLRSSASAERSGQLMHHFISLAPTYESIAGSEQLGPNIFWTWSVLRYVALSQDSDFAAKMLPYVDLSTKFLLTFFDETMDLIYAPGPLWIDVLVRENYTSDSSPILVPLLNLIADYYDYLEEDPDFSSLLRSVGSRIVTAMNKYLWSPEGDHFITQLNPDGTTRDFIDYDSNLLTVAFNVADSDKVAALLNRVDNGEYTHIRATWCSEIPYTGDACDCYIVGGTVCGDSVVTLARIGWVDALARKQVGDLQTFNDLLLTPLQNDLVENVWLYERYDANGTQIRTSYYFEYPSLVTMMLREVRYGINIGVSDVSIDPFPIADFSYHLGALNIEYSQSSVQIGLPGSSDLAKSKTVKVFGLQPSVNYAVSGTGSCSTVTSTSSAVADETGLLQLQWKFTDGCVLNIQKQ